MQDFSNKFEYLVLGGNSRTHFLAAVKVPPPPPPPPPDD
jgi:hypothetical protein